jgi:hypothetical protein
VLTELLEENPDYARRGEVEQLLQSL